MVRTLKYDLLDIKKYKSCKDCGKCCGPVPITEDDVKEIGEYIKENKIKVRKVDPLSLNCIFRDEKSKKCLIYPVRPLICRLFRCDNPVLVATEAERFKEYYPDIKTSVMLNSVDWSKQFE